MTSATCLMFYYTVKLRTHDDDEVDAVIGSTVDATAPQRSVPPFTKLFYPFHTANRGNMRCS